ncbi:MAG: hypothetical protein ACFFAQ_03955 [Promethearchaeota archaeon]
MLSKSHDSKLKAKDSKSKSEEVEGSDDANYFIWKVNPSFKDIKNSTAILKSIFIVSLLVFIISSIYMATSNLTISTGVGIIILILFFITFQDQFFSLSSLFSYTFGKFRSFNPFEKMIFWQEKDNPTIVYLSNKQDLTHIGLRLFKIEVLPENVHAAIDTFIRSLSEGSSLTPYSYQVVQNPYYIKRSISRDIAVGSQESIETFIYFSVYYMIKGILRESKRELLKYKLDQITSKLKSDFICNFHHYRIALLSGTRLLNALRTHFIRDNGTYKSEIDTDFYFFNNHRSFLIAKLLFCSLLMVTCDYLLLVNNFGFGFVLFFNTSLIGIICILWWRELLFQVSKKQLLNNEEISLIYPFKDIDFFCFRKIPDSIFLLVDNRILINRKLLNLHYASPPAYGSADKFYQALMSQKIPFTFTAINTPISFYRFYKEGFKYLKEDVIDKLLYKEEHGLKTTQDELNWLNRCSGMWRTILLLSTSSNKLVNSVKVEHIMKLEEKLRSDINLVKNAFHMNFLNYKLVELQKRKLVSGYLCETIKNKFTRLNGTHLNYILFQGKILINLTRIVDILKKGVETRIAAEFNTPLHLPNFITIGHTVNTEVLEEEIPFGLLLDQLKNLLITNGTLKSRDLACMKIVSELVKVNVPSIIFDFNGTWSKLIAYFKDSRFENDLLYFKLGSAFTLDPLQSDIPYDPNNIQYLEYMYDSYALAFKKDERTVDIFRTNIQKHPDMDLPSLSLELLNQREWEKRPMNYTLTSLFSDFSQEDLTLFFSSHKGSNCTISPLKFITNEKTIILDLSISNDFRKQLFFTFIIVSKFLHYIKNSREFIPKILVIPHIDLFFDNNHIEQKINYGIINTFLDPLLQNKFGLIFSANQIHYLHPNLFKCLTNHLTFRATDSKDIGVLKNQMNLQELVGRGYYTSSRNNTYQIDYLMNLKDDEVIVKRSDIYQPFPAKLTWSNLKVINLLKTEEIIHFMKGQGYDLKSTEQQILQQTKQTIFEKDLGSYVLYLDEIQQFLEHLKTVDQIGNLYKKKIKEELKQYIAPKAKKRQYTNPEIVKLVEQLFGILVRHRYLVENHPKKAGGSEAIRTSYSVGDQLDKAIEDYYQIKAELEISVDVLEKESQEPFDYKKMLQNQDRTYIIKKRNLKEAFAREFSDLYWTIFKAHSFINHKEYQNALKILHNLIKKFLMSVYKHFYNADYIVTTKDLEKFITEISKNPDILFTQEELHDYLEQYQIINFDEENLKELVIEMYTYYSQFFEKIQLYINKA